tara:strand:+ start:886 stop:1200 length:315 start_codon:yes stop_codon:yes gene_type:complete
MSVIGIVLSVVALSLIYWLRKEQTMDNGLHAAELDHTHHGMNAMMDDFNKYQVETDRKIAELEKQLEIKTKQLDRKTDKVIKNLPVMIGKIVSQVEFAQDKINK